MTLLEQVENNHKQARILFRMVPPLGATIQTDQDTIELLAQPNELPGGECRWLARHDDLWVWLGEGMDKIQVRCRVEVKITPVASKKWPLGNVVEIINLSEAYK